MDEHIHATQICVGRSVGPKQVILYSPTSYTIACISFSHQEFFTINSSIVHGLSFTECLIHNCPCLFLGKFGAGAESNWTWGALFRRRTLFFCFGCKLQVVHFIVSPLLVLFQSPSACQSFSTHAHAAPASQTYKDFKWITLSANQIFTERRHFVAWKWDQNKPAIFYLIFLSLSYLLPVVKKAWQELSQQWDRCWILAVLDLIPDISSFHIRYKIQGI